MKKLFSKKNEEGVSWAEEEVGRLRGECSRLEAEKESLEDELRSIKSSLAISQNQIKSIRGSITYRVGSLVVNSRTPRGLIRLPWRLLKIYLEYKGRKSKELGRLIDHDAEAADKFVEKRPVYDQFWIGFYNPESSQGFLICESHNDQLYRYKLEDCVQGDAFEFAFPFHDGYPPFSLDNKFTVTVKEVSRAGEVLCSRIFEPPVNSYKSAEAYVGGGALSLSFLHKITSASCSSIEVEVWLSNNTFKKDGDEFFYELRCRKFSAGVSVIIPSYKGEGTIARCLDYMASQTLDRSFFELIIVLNGVLDSSENIIERFGKNHPDLKLKVLKTPFANAGNARNVGLSAACFEYVTFVDDDDFVSENYLEKLLVASSYESISVATVMDVDDAGKVYDNVINQQLENAKNYRECRYADVSSVLTMNACKMLPTSFASQLLYNSELPSGEDVCYFARYISRFCPLLNLEPVRSSAVYYRFLSSQSVSRQPASFDFNVKQRVEVIQSIDKCFPFAESKEVKDFLVSKMIAQSGFVQMYLQDHREDISHYASIVQKQVVNFSYDQKIASNLSDTIVYSYCFAPYVDTAGIVMAKRIREEGVPVDVVCNTMDRVRNVDERLDRITAGLLGRKIVIKGQPSFSSWPEIQRFADSAKKGVIKLEKSRPGYRVVYSRAMWVASHFAAVLHKIRRPDVIWRAEFSDPILKDVNGLNREVSLDLNWLKSNGVFDALVERDVVIPESDNLFFWCEFLVYIFADEIIFTNENQFDYMLSYSGLGAEQGTLVRDKSVVKHHPILPEFFYNISDPSYDIDEGFVNVAYFGSFYSTRGLSEVFSVVDKYRSCLSKVRFHVFTNDQEKVLSEANALGIQESVAVNGYFAFIDFLALTNKFDCLVVNDAVTSGVKCINPYLPSKLSDYLGSQSVVWAIAEESSILFRISVSERSGKIFTSLVGDEESHYKVLCDLLVRKFGDV